MPCAGRRAIGCGYATSMTALVSQAWCSAPFLHPPTGEALKVKRPSLFAHVFIAVPEMISLWLKMS